MSNNIYLVECISRILRLYEPDIFKRANDNDFIEFKYINASPDGVYDVCLRITKRKEKKSRIKGFGFGGMIIDDP